MPDLSIKGNIDIIGGKSISYEENRYKNLINFSYSLQHILKNHFILIFVGPFLYHELRGPCDLQKVRKCYMKIICIVSKITFFLLCVCCSTEFLPFAYFKSSTSADLIFLS